MTAAWWKARFEAVAEDAVGRPYGGAEDAAFLAHNRELWREMQRAAEYVELTTAHIRSVRNSFKV